MDIFVWHMYQYCKNIPSSGGYPSATSVIDCRSWRKDSREGSYTLTAYIYMMSWSPIFTWCFTILHLISTRCLTLLQLTAYIDMMFCTPTAYIYMMVYNITAYIYMHIYSNVFDLNVQDTLIFEIFETSKVFKIFEILSPHNSRWRLVQSAGLFPDTCWLCRVLPRFCKIIIILVPPWFLQS